MLRKEYRKLVSEIKNMKILHTSDWHLGATDIGRSLIADQQFFVEEICKVISEEHCDAILIAGDVYDRSVSSAEAINLFNMAATKICTGLGVPLLMIAGNHDSAERISNCRALLAQAGLHVVGSIEREPQVVTIKDSEFFFLPWITEEKVKSIFPEESERIHSLEDAYAVTLDSFRAAFTPGKKHILIAHAFVTSAETSSSDKAAEIGFATQIPASVFDGFDYVALGHLHKPQSVTPTVRYSGTPMPYSFGKEERQQKSVTIVDTGDMSQEIVPLPLLHSRVTVSGTYEEVLHPNISEEQKNGYVQVRVSDSYIGLDALAELRSIYPNLISVVGKTFDNENASVSLTVQELEKLETDPIEVFKYFCKEETDVEPDDHLVTLFTNAMEKSSSEVEK